MVFPIIKANARRIILLLCLVVLSARVAGQPAFLADLAQAAEELTTQQVRYDPSYFSIAYPNGDVPADRGVCTDVVIRAYRKLGIDLQREVHEDMSANFTLYPALWGLSRPDRNIDHRRVPNLMTFLQGTAPSGRCHSKRTTITRAPSSVGTWGTD